VKTGTAKPRTTIPDPGEPAPGPQLARERFLEFVAFCERERRFNESLLDTGRRLMVTLAYAECGKQRLVARILRLSTRMVNYHLEQAGVLRPTDRGERKRIAYNPRKKLRIARSA
jgi:hypothetical protein